MQIGVIGCGYVGSRMCEFFDKKYDVREYDINWYETADAEIKAREDIQKCDVAVVCVPTQSKPDGSCNTDIVEGTIAILKNPLIIIKSTVSPGTTARLAKKYNKPLVFSPEYCGESSYWSPYTFDRSIVDLPWYTFGGPKELTAKCVDLYLPIAGPAKRYIQTDSTSAELAKYAANCFFATKVAFCYEFANICKVLGADYNEVRELWIADPRMNPMHTAVFQDNPKPFGGKCFPKDLAALIYASRENGFRPPILQSVEFLNNMYGQIVKGEIPNEEETKGN